RRGAPGARLCRPGCPPGSPGPERVDDLPEAREDQGPSARRRRASSPAPRSQRSVSPPGGGLAQRRGSAGGASRPADRCARRATLALMVLAMLAGPGRTAPEPVGPELVRWLDADAPIVVRMEASTLESLATLARTIGRDAGIAAALTTLGGVRYLGFDPLSHKGWQSAGLDPEAPALIQLAAIDAVATDRIYRELARTGGQWGTHRRSSPPLWRSRLVARASDPDKATETFTSGAL